LEEGNRIVGGLLWVGLFIKPQSKGSIILPVFEQRDHYYGLAKTPDGSRSEYRNLLSIICFHNVEAQVDDDFMGLIF
jgi:hypothetical protein